MFSVIRNINFMYLLILDYKANQHQASNTAPTSHQPPTNTTTTTSRQPPTNTTTTTSSQPPTTEHKGIILPVYTDAEDEHFWLFYCPSTSLGKILKLKQGKAKLKGYWLNLKTLETSTYELLLPDAQQEIEFRWIIKCDLGPLYLQHNLELKVGAEFIIPAIFKTRIIETLEKANLI